jgi:hypothetical protein
MVLMICSLIMNDVVSEIAFSSLVKEYLPLVHFHLQRHYVGEMHYTYVFGAIEMLSVALTAISFWPLSQYKFNHLNPRANQ